MRINFRTTVVAAGALALAVGLSGCSSSDDTGSEPAASGTAATIAKDDALAALVPAEVAADGVLTIGTDASYAPGQFLDVDGETIIGFDVDLAKAVAQVLGLEPQMENAPFGSLVEGVKTGKYELGASSFTINAERQLQVDMVSYFMAGTSWAVAAGNPMQISPDDACGKVVAVQRDTVQVPDIEARS
ncbi:MAG TPA: transporter substrate-binding domain-containing protein, partial [Candidatus Limnocylindrales bacterium]|nr:transporter substrate-binding domain-containing protein [Candidatus Limnocylindrales bacterium]